MPLYLPSTCRGVAAGLGSALPAGGHGGECGKYLAPYIFRVAISNRRIKLADGKVTFRYRDTESGALKTCTLPAEEFIHRFLQHVLPKGFVKVRYYGFLAVGQRQRLAVLRKQLSCPVKETPVATDVPRHTEVRCPSCGQVMWRGVVIHPMAHRPP